MAPRRGGGGGGYSYGDSSSVSNRCAEAGAFADTLSRGFLAIMAVFAALQILVIIMYFVVRLRTKTTKNIARFYTFGFSIVLALL
ncbi:hypothetical protein EJ05DRAFT_480643 [Pseudovirgaria hyperparasitica]|uniref:Uncharacterized protein n=1 Tax=Pseudovirgaria hyperparasitica TaxID=470096 RepID=A0A6A6VTC4_9PEZI|nr:uncharacterized protein EJ05DRAFT_480643 [Pseudovirgaria hyperparasitica]KAF2753129.1 hypothetical protein EJ05DRAFT_480643 [Pseudovirgaria hyperparasitica]